MACISVSFIDLPRRRIGAPNLAFRRMLRFRLHSAPSQAGPAAQHAFGGALSFRRGPLSCGRAARAGRGRGLGVLLADARRGALQKHRAVISAASGAGGRFPPRATVRRARRLPPRRDRGAVRTAGPRVFFQAGLPAHRLQPAGLPGQERKNGRVAAAVPERVGNETVARFRPVGFRADQRLRIQAPSGPW